jgi:hypothetical protein
VYITCMPSARGASEFTWRSNVGASPTCHLHQDASASCAQAAHWRIIVITAHGNIWARGVMGCGPSRHGLVALVMVYKASRNNTGEEKKKQK